MEVSSDKPGIDLDGPVVVSNGLFTLLSGLSGTAPIKIGFIKLSVELNRLVAVGDGSLPFALNPKDNAAI